MSYFLFVRTIHEEYWWENARGWNGWINRCCVDDSFVTFCKHILIKLVRRCQTACFFASLALVRFRCGVVWCVVVFISILYVDRAFSVPRSFFFRSTFVDNVLWYEHRQACTYTNIISQCWSLQIQILNENKFTHKGFQFNSENHLWSRLFILFYTGLPTRVWHKLSQAHIHRNDLPACLPVYTNEFKYENISDKNFTMKNDGKATSTLRVKSQTEQNRTEHTHCNRLLVFVIFHAIPNVWVFRMKFNHFADSMGFCVFSFIFDKPAQYTRFICTQNNSTRFFNKRKKKKSFFFAKISIALKIVDIFI